MTDPIDRKELSGMIETPGTDAEWEKRKDWTLDQLADEVIEVCELRKGCRGTLVGALYDAKRQGEALNAVYAELLLRAVQACKTWIEHENSEDMGWVLVQAEGFLKDGGGAHCGYHPDYYDACKATIAALATINGEMTRATAPESSSRRHAAGEHAPTGDGSVPLSTNEARVVGVALECPACGWKRDGKNLGSTLLDTRDALRGLVDAFDDARGNPGGPNGVQMNALEAAISTADAILESGGEPVQGEGLTLPGIGIDELVAREEAIPERAEALQTARVDLATQLSPRLTNAVIEACARVCDGRANAHDFFLQAASEARKCGTAIRSLKGVEGGVLNPPCAECGKPSVTCLGSALNCDWKWVCKAHAQCNGKQVS